MQNRRALRNGQVLPDVGANDVGDTAAIGYSTCSPNLAHQNSFSWLSERSIS